MEEFGMVVCPLRSKDLDELALVPVLTRLPVERRRSIELFDTEDVGGLLLFSKDDSRRVRDFMQRETGDWAGTREFRPKNFFGQRLSIAIAPLNLKAPLWGEKWNHWGLEFAVFVVDPGLDGRTDLRKDAIIRVWPDPDFLDQVVKFRANKTARDNSGQRDAVERRVNHGKRIGILSDWSRK